MIRFLIPVFQKGRTVSDNGMQTELVVLFAAFCILFGIAPLLHSFYSHLFHTWTLDCSQDCQQCVIKKCKAKLCIFPCNSYNGRSLRGWSLSLNSWNGWVNGWLYLNTWIFLLLQPAKTIHLYNYVWSNYGRPCRQRISWSDGSYVKCMTWGKICLIKFSLLCFVLIFLRQERENISRRCPWALSIQVFDDSSGIVLSVIHIPATSLQS